MNVMKKLLFFIFILLISIIAFGIEWKYVTDVDIDMPVVIKNIAIPLPVPIHSKLIMNAHEIKGFKGFNVFQLGYYFKEYLLPVKPNTFDMYLNFGTVLFMVPYLDWGIDYISSSGVYVGLYIPLAFIPLNCIYSSLQMKPSPLLGFNFGFFY